MVAQQDARLREQTYVSPMNSVGSVRGGVSVWQVCENPMIVSGLRILLAAGAIAAALWPTVSCGGEARPAIQLATAERTVQGMLVTRTEQEAWVVAPDGRLNVVELARVRDFSVVADQFESLTKLELRTQLREELGPQFEVAIGGPFVVAAPKAMADAVSAVAENVAVEFRHYFSVRGFDLQSPPYPLVLVVYPDHGSFVSHAHRDDVPVSSTMLGYYHALTNRVSLFDPAAERIEIPPLPAKPKPVLQPQLPPEPPTDGPPRRPQLISLLRTPPETGRIAAWESAGLDPLLRDVIVHEATHQLAYNLGLHSRICRPPRWVVEGLATMFEAAGDVPAGNQRTVMKRVNRERLGQFLDYLDHRRDADSLKKLLKSDQPFQTRSLDAYGEAWALTFYLTETSSRKYAKYLQAQSARTEPEERLSEQRLSEFKDEFGTDLAEFDRKFVRFFRDLQ